MSINAGSIIASLDLDTGQFSTKLSQAQNQADGFVGKLKGYGGAFEDLGKGLTLGVSVPIAGIGVAAGKTAIDFESAFAGVIKTVDATDSQLSKLETGIRDMSKEIPASATAIAGVAEAAGQLGIETDNILGFTRVMIDLGESTNLSADQAATSLARLANITGMSQLDFDKLGSTIVDLGNNLATTEAEIVAMGLRLAGAGSQIGLSEAQIMSFAGALSSVGIEAEAGGSAFSKVMIEMQLAAETNSKKLGEFADVAGMSGAEFKKAFQEDAAGAIIAFIQGLGNAEERGLSAIKVLDDMGITEVRLRDALLRASGASDVFTNSLEIGTKAWDENTALTKEAEQRYKTTASQIEIANNHLKDAGITVGEIVVPYFISFAEKVKEVSRWFSDLNPKTQESIVKMAGLAAAIGPVLFVGGKMVTGLGSVVGLMGKTAAVSKDVNFAFQAVRVGAATFGESIKYLVGGAGGAGGALGGVTAGFGASVLAMAPWVIGIGAAVVGGVALAKHLQKDLIPAVELFDDTISESTKAAITSFLDLEKEATTSLNQLAWGGQEITHEMAEKISGNFNTMSESIITSLEEQKHKALDKLNGLSDEASLIADRQRGKIVEILNKSYDEQILKTQEGQDRINAIIEKALADGRKLYWTEEMEIKRVKESMKETAVRVLSESEKEQLAIMERLKAESGKISALQSAEVVKNSLEQKEQTIAEAEEAYNEQMKLAGQLRLKGGAEAEMYADLIVAQAKKQKKESIARAEEMHAGVVKEAQTQAGEHVDEVDWETGEIMSLWDKAVKWFKENPIIKQIFTKEGAAAERNDRLNPVNFNARSSSENMMNMFVEGIDSKRPEVERAVSDVAKTTEEYLGFRSPTEKGPGSTADTWMPNMVQMLADGINSNAFKVKNASDDLANKIKESMDKTSGYIQKTVSIIEKEFKLWQTKNQDVKGSSEELEKQLEMQKQKQVLLTEELKIAEKALTEITIKYGEGSLAALDYKDKVLGLQIEHSNLTTEINKSAEAMRNLISIANKQAIDREIERNRAQGVLDEYNIRKHTSDERYDDMYDRIWAEDSKGNLIAGNSKVGFRKVVMDSLINVTQKDWENSDIGKGLLRAFDKYGITDDEYQAMKDIAKQQQKIGKNAHGTNYWNGGWTWVGEQGPEIIELPRGSKVHSNQKSMEMTSSKGGDIYQEIHIHSPTPLSPSESARKYKQASQQLAMEWGF